LSSCICFLYLFPNSSHFLPGFLSSTDPAVFSLLIRWFKLCLLTTGYPRNLC
jgi:hypothetical protein